MVSCDNIVSRKMWSPNEEIMGSTWRELKAIYYALLSFFEVTLLKGQNVHWHSDNQGTISVAKFGSTKIHLQKLALDVFALCVHNNVSIYILNGSQEVLIKLQTKSVNS